MRLKINFDVIYLNRNVLITSIPRLQQNPSFHPISDQKDYMNYPRDENQNEFLFTCFHHQQLISILHHYNMSAADPFSSAH